MQAISTKYLPATNTRGSRIKAICVSGRSKTVSYPFDVQAGEAAHWEAAYALASALGWEGDYVAGSTADGYVFVRASVQGGVIATVRRVPPAACATQVSK